MTHTDETRAQLRKLCEMQRAALADVTAQRNALLTACRELRDWAVCADDGTTIRENMDPQLFATLRRADAAIASARSP